MARRIRRWGWAMAIAGLLALGLGYAFWPVAVEVDLALVTRGPMQVGVTDDGVTRAEDYYVVSAPVTGYLSRVELEPGDRVTRGAVLGWMGGRPSSPLDPRSDRELRSALAAAEAGSAGSDAALGQARRDLVRAEELAARGFLPRAELEATRTRAATAQAVRAQARAEAARLRALLGQPLGAGVERVPVRAPESGAVLAILTESEGVIAEGTPVMTLGDPAGIEVVVDLLSREAVRVRPGDHVRITEWGGPDPLPGIVQRVEPYGRLKISALGIEEQRVNVIVGLDPAAGARAARLGHGYQVDATIVLWSAEKTLRVPVGALFRGSDGEWRVFVEADGRTRERAVALGHFDDAFAEVLDGLAEGDRVVVNPSNTLREGARLAPR